MNEQYRVLNEDHPRAARPRHPLRPPRRLVERAARLARALFPRGDRSGIEPDDSRSDSTDTAHLEQEPELHREPARPRRIRRAQHRAIVQAPRSLPRLIPLPAPLGGTGKADFVFLSSVIHAFVDQLFAGMEIIGCYQFRVTRNSDLFIDDEDVDDLKHALEGELFESRYGAAVRLETAYDCSDELATYLLEHFQLSPAISIRSWDR